MEKQKGLLICTIVFAIIAIISLSLNVVLLITDSDRNEVKTDIETEVQIETETQVETKNETLASLANPNSIDLSVFNKKTISPTYSHEGYDMHSLQTNVFGLGKEMLSIKKEKHGISVARVIIHLDNANTLDEAQKTIVEELKEVNHIVDVMQITKTVNQQTVKIESLSNENISDAERLNLALRVNKSVLNDVSAINISIRPEKIEERLTYEIIVSYFYKETTSDVEQEVPVIDATEETHTHNH